MSFKISRRKTDDLYTRYIRRRDDYTCQCCGRQFSPDNCGTLGVSHYWGRGHENTRFDDDNCVALCNLPCHKYWGEDPNGAVEYRLFMYKRLGKDGYDALEVRKELRKKRDDAADLIILKKMLEDQKQTTSNSIVGYVEDF